MTAPPTPPRLRALFQRRPRAAAPPQPAPAQGEGVLVWVAFGLLLALALKLAWVSDDALITMRTVDNLVAGYGAVWNVGERVQAYTHPLWMLVLTAVYAPLRDVYAAPLVAGLLCTAAAAAVLALGVARSAVGAVVALATLACSKAFVEYSTSGLENPLSHLLIALILWLYLGRPTTPRSLLKLSLAVGLLALNRQDMLLLAGPPLAVAALAPGAPAARAALAGGGRRWGAAARALLSPARLAAVALGLAPLGLWTLFSLFYYGFPFPNTAYAKLNTGLGAGELVPQGLLYLLNALEFDPLAPLAIGLGAALPLVRRDWWAAAASAGIALYLAYVVRIGGDFMSGRFVTGPLMASACLIAALLPAATRLYALAAAAALLGALNPRGALLADSDRYGGPQVRAGIADERYFYGPHAALAQLGREGPFQTQRYQAAGRAARAQPVIATEPIGFYGLVAGREGYVVDTLALSDPLLARLPARFDTRWRIGHFRRAVPAGYLETAAGERNLLADPGLAAYYDALRLITRGDLLDPARLAAIWRINTGGYEHLIDRDAYRFPGLLRLPYAEARDPAAPPRPLGPEGVAVVFDAPDHAARLAVAFDGRADLAALFFRDGAEVARLRVPGRDDPLGARAVYELAAPPAAVSRGYDELRLFPYAAGPVSLGPVRLLAPGEPAAAIAAAYGPEWRLPLEDDEGTRWAASPAGILVTAAEAQPLWLRLTPGRIFDPAAAGGDGARGELRVTAGTGPAASVPLERGAPVELPLALPAGGGRIELALAAAQALPDDAGFPPEAQGFAAAELHLLTVRDRPPPADILVDGAPQQGEPGRHLVYRGAGWGDGQEAELLIYSPRAGRATLRLSPPGGGVTLRVSVDGGPASEVRAQPDGALAAELALAEGWSRVGLEANGGDVRAARLELVTEP